MFLLIFDDRRDIVKASFVALVIHLWLGFDQDFLSVHFGDAFVADSAIAPQDGVQGIGEHCHCFGRDIPGDLSGAVRPINLFDFGQVHIRPRPVEFEIELDKGRALACATAKFMVHDNTMIVALGQRGAALHVVAGGGPQ